MDVVLQNEGPRGLSENVLLVIDQTAILLHVGHLAARRPSATLEVRVDRKIKLEDIFQFPLILAIQLACYEHLLEWTISNLPELSSISNTNPRSFPNQTRDHLVVVVLAVCVDIILFSLITIVLPRA